MLIIFIITPRVINFVRVLNWYWTHRGSFREMACFSALSHLLTSTYCQMKLQSKYSNFHSLKKELKMLSTKKWLFGLGLNVLNWDLHRGIMGYSHNFLMRKNASRLLSWGIIWSSCRSSTYLWNIDNHEITAKCSLNAGCLETMKCFVMQRCNYKLIIIWYKSIWKVHMKSYKQNIATNDISYNKKDIQYIEDFYL